MPSDMFPQPQAAVRSTSYKSIAKIPSAEHSQSEGVLEDVDLYEQNRFVTK